MTYYRVLITIIMLFSVGSLIGSYLKRDKSAENEMVEQYGVINCILSIITLMILKNVYLSGIVGNTLLAINIFVFLLLVKYVLLSLAKKE